MARMVPGIPRASSPASHERELFESLRKLDEGYWVFHSFKLKDSRARPIQEIDFVVYHRERGILCIEAKASPRVAYHDGGWWRTVTVDGKDTEEPMGKILHNPDGSVSREGPYEQAANGAYDVLSALKELGLSSACVVTSAVWLLGVSSQAFREMIQGQVGEVANLDKITLTKEDLKYGPAKKIDSIFQIARLSSVNRRMSDADEKRLLDRFLYPNLRIVSDTWSDQLNLQRMVFHQLTEEQFKILDFLDGQRSIVINGTAGTGKTLVAIQKAFRAARRGERVLFLCYNRLLRDYLVGKFSGCPNVTSLTLHGLCLKFGVNPGDWDSLVSKILESSGRLLYDHIIVDEGQDFGRKVNVDNLTTTDTKQYEILDALELSLLDGDDGGAHRSFTVFYDRYQLVRRDGKDGVSFPSYIENADCKLTLYRNCRNSRTVASSVMGLMGMKFQLYEFDNHVAVDGTKMFFPKGYPHPDFKDYYRTLTDVCEQEIAKYPDKDEGVVIISCGLNSLEHSDLGVKGLLSFDAESKSHGSLKFNDHQGKMRFVPIYTARAFKGLEADSVILIDLLPEAFKSPEEEGARLVYVAASRARISLKIVVGWSEAQYRHLNGCGFTIAGDVTKSVGKALAKKFVAAPYFK